MEPSPSFPRVFVSRTSLPSDRLAASAARAFVRSVLVEQVASPDLSSVAITDRFVDDAVLLVDELVTNAVMHAGTEIEVILRLEAGLRFPAAVAPGVGGDGGSGGLTGAERRPGLVVEVVDHHPSSAVSRGTDARHGRRGLGLQVVGALAESWGVTYRHTAKTVWFRLEARTEEPELLVTADLGARSDTEEAEPSAPAPDRPARDQEPEAARQNSAASRRVDRIGPSFLAEASELLAGQLDEDMVAALAGQLVVPRLADWCAVWLSTDSGRMRLSRIWHMDERMTETLRPVLEKNPPPPSLRTAGFPWPWPWPEDHDADGAGGSVLAFPLVTGGACQGVLLLGRAGRMQMSDSVVRKVEDVARLVAQAVVTARQYTRQTTISQALQRRQLPPSLARVPGVETAIVYEPFGEAQTVGGDFYDLFPMGGRRWCFLLGDVQGKDPEAMSVTGLARHLVRLLAREGHGVESVLHRLNIAMAEESAEAVAYGGEQAHPRFLSLLYGELEPDPVAGGARCTIASAGHPLPLRLFPDGTVEPAADPQMLLGIDRSTRFSANTFDLALGETLLCVTDGVTERRNGNRQLDDDDGLSEVLRGCAGMGAMAVAERVRQVAHDFAPEPMEDDLAVLVMHAVRGPVRARTIGPQDGTAAGAPDTGA
ncbi:SpoIIE family protein phosphatase [Streptomyces sp. NPDC047108]|uniref:SpoIIE family protein phosphatase n=1 Tax=Streptomyces sp. NPDC047108 TaxID=3155025 RepID=UPI0033D0480D